METEVKRRGIGTGVTVGALVVALCGFFILPMQVGADEEPRVDRLCGTWERSASQMHADVAAVAAGEDPQFSPELQRQGLETFPENSVDRVLSTLALDASEAGKSEEEVVALVGEKCREYRSRYIVTRSRDPDPEKREE